MGAKNEPFLYDPTLTYAQNLKQGPFGDFSRRYKNRGNPEYDFFGTKVYAPFGIAAGPLPRANFIDAALRKGFDIVTFKSVRSEMYPCYPAPNIVPLELTRLDPGKTSAPIITKERFDFPLSVANSYGIPSFSPEIWQDEIRKAFQYVGKGQAMLVAFQGTNREKGRAAFIDDHVSGVKLLRETGARVIEINLSCPNEGSKRLLCFDKKTTRIILEKVKAAVPDTRLIIKITYFDDKQALRALIDDVHHLIDGVTAINTIANKVVRHDGVQAFSRSADRAAPGVSGAAIKHAGLEMVGELCRHRKDRGYSYQIIGVGGVQSAQDFHAYQKEGADIVMSLTGAMWKPDLASEVKASL